MNLCPNAKENTLRNSSNYNHLSTKSYQKGYFKYFKYFIHVIRILIVVYGWITGGEDTYVIVKVFYVVDLWTCSMLWNYSSVAYCESVPCCGIVNLFHVMELWICSLMWNGESVAYCEIVQQYNTMYVFMC